MYGVHAEQPGSGRGHSEGLPTGPQWPAPSQASTPLGSPEPPQAPSHLVPFGAGVPLGQPHSPPTVGSLSAGQGSMQSASPSPSESVSGTPQPHTPRRISGLWSGHSSMQLGVPSPSLSVSGTAQPH